MSTFPGGTGYTCALCRAFVPYGVTHSCGGLPTFPIQPVQPIAPDAVAMALGRIEALLQQILRKLETQP